MKAATIRRIDRYVDLYRNLRARVDTLCASAQEVAWRNLGKLFLALVRAFGNGPDAASAAMWMLGVSSQWRGKRCNQ